MRTQKLSKREHNATVHVGESSKFGKPPRLDYPSTTKRKRSRIMNKTLETDYHKRTPSLAGTERPPPTVNSMLNRILKKTF